MTVTIQQSLKLPCGAVLKNRIVKAAMTEGLADPYNRVTPELIHLYRRWARNGFGLLVTGNLHVDRRCLERPGNMAIDNNGGFDRLRELAAVGTQDGAHFWVQINHAGRQTPESVNPEPLAPSAIALPMAEAGCGTPRAMTGAEIHDAIRRFAHVATVCRDVGFTGVQIHGAHGYLISQFLSPLANQREDEWGGTLENRARFLLETVRAVRKAVGDDFPLALKLNSADFQRGGFDSTESMQVVEWLSREHLDMLEISGGNYEQMQMVGLGEEATGRVAAASTRAREAYFLDYARQVRPRASMPLMITGGMRAVATMNEALDSGACELIGIGRPLCVSPDGFGADLLAGKIDEIPTIERTLAMPRDALGGDIDDETFKKLESFGLLGWYCLQVMRVGRGEDPDMAMSVVDALGGYEVSETQAAEIWKGPGAVPA